MPTWLIATISAVSLHLWPRLMSLALTEGRRLSPYHTSQGTYFGFHSNGGAIRVYRITPTNPPTIVFAWSMSQGGRGSPWVQPLTEPTM